MTLTEAEVADLAETLYEAFDTKTPIEPVTETAELTVEDAYAVQSAVLGRIRADPDAVVGHKLGLVSEAKQEQLGIPEPIFCQVLPETVVDDRTVDTDAYIAPRVEAEIGLLLGEDVPAGASPADVLAATHAVVPVVEILETRYAGWTIPTAQDVIADLTSAAGVVVGETLRDPRDVDLAMESVVISVNGEVASSGVGAAIMGHPARAVSWLAGRLPDVDDGLGAGELIMTGGITAAIDVEPGDVYSIRFANIGSIELHAT